MTSPPLALYLVVAEWQKIVNLFALQEDKIYAQRDNDGHANELWNCSRHWLTFERLLSSHRVFLSEVEILIDSVLRHNKVNLLIGGIDDGEETAEENDSGKSTERMRKKAGKLNKK